MSFDVYAQRFVDGEPVDEDSGLVRDLVAPHVARIESGSDFAELHFDDGTADFYGIANPGTGFMVNHISGDRAWDLLARVASGGDMVLMAPSVPPMIFNDAARRHLPVALQDEVVVLATGADILRTITGA